MLRMTATLIVLLLLGGCWNDNRGIAIRLGDVSIGQQLIDLKAALDQGAMTQAEYESVRARLIELNLACNEAGAEAEADQ